MPPPLPPGGGAELGSADSRGDKVSCAALQHAGAGSGGAQAAETMAQVQARAAEAVDEQRRKWNASLAPELRQPGSTGVEALAVPSEEAAACATFLKERWAREKLTLPNGKRLLGYATYPKTLARHSAKEQRAHTLLITNAWLDEVRESVPGFEPMERHLLAWLKQRMGHEYQLFYAHGLRQSPATLAGAVFDVHQDTEEFDFIEHTIVVKLTADVPGESPSSMRVVGADQHFEYGTGAGAAGCFDARLHHASVAPRSEEEHLKLAYFFRRDEKAERLASRPEVAMEHLARELRDDCGKCRFCLDMTKFGGPNKLRRRCIERQKWR